MSKTVLYVEGCRDGTVGGSHTVLYRMLREMDRSIVTPVVVMYEENWLAESIRRLGIDLRLLPNEPQFDFGRWLESRWRSAPLLTAALRPVQKAANFTWYFARPVVGCLGMIREFQVDIVHLNNSLNTDHEWIVAARVAGVPLVSHERGISMRLSGTSRYLSRWVNRFVCVSHAVKEPLLKQGIDGRRIEVIYDGLMRAELEASVPAEDVRDKHAIPPDAPLVGVMGNIKPWKGQETVIRSVALLRERWPNICCLLVGSPVSAPDYRSRLEELVASLDLREAVRFVDFQDRPRDYLAAMDVVIHSSVEPEPFGMVNLEAMSLGKAVVSTTIGGPPEIFEHGRTGLLVDPGDPALLSEAVDALLSDEGLRKRIGAAARAAVAQRFTMERTLEALYGIYAEL